MTVVSDWDVVSDAELACAAAAGDRAAFAGIYDRYADRLHDFCVGMVRDRDAAADCVQDVFCTAATTLAQLREPDKLRPWLYAIARHEALRFIRQRRREQVSDELPEMVSREAGPDTLAARGELADLIAEAANGLTDRDRTVLELSYRHGMNHSELAQALDTSTECAKKMVQRLRETVERSLGALLVARNAQQDPSRCPELAGILAGWDGQFTILMRKRIARHIESCQACERERRRRVNPVALLGAAPVFIPAPGRLREQTLGQIQLSSAATPFTSGSAGSGAGSAQAHGDHLDRVTDHARRGVRMAGLFAAAMVTAMGLTIMWLHHRDTPVSPTDMTAPQPLEVPRRAASVTTTATTAAPAPSTATVTSVAPAAPPSTATVTSPVPTTVVSTVPTTVTKEVLPPPVTVTVTRTVPTTVTTTVTTTVKVGGSGGGSGSGTGCARCGQIP
jgi:RNA polymerase sigma factor (sigma-70 family)